MEKTVEKASALISKRIDGLGDWRGKTLAKALVRQAVALDKARTQ